MMAVTNLRQGGYSRNGTRALLRVVMRRKLLLATPLLLALAFGWFLYDNLPRRYTAEAVLVVDLRTIQIVDKAVVSQLPQENPALRTELDIITSRSLVERVVDRLGLGADAGVLREVGANRAMPWLLIDIARQAAEDALHSFGAASLLAEGPPPKPSRSEIVDWLLANLAVSNDNRSFTIFVDFRSENPERASRIANAVAQGYLDDQVDLKATTTRQASTWLAEKLGEMRQEVAVADEAVANFRRASGLIEAKGATVAGQQLSELNTQLVLARAERARMESKLQTARSSNGASLPDVLSSPTIEDLRRSLAQAEVHLAENAKNVFLLPDLQRPVDSLKKQIDAEVARIIAGIAGEAEAARTREVALETALQNLQAEYGEASTGIVKLNQLRREADADRTIYEAFLTRYKEAVEQEGLATPDARLIAKAQTPTSPVFPRKLPVLMLSGLSGVLFGGLAVAARERLDGRIRELGQLDTVTGIPILGIMPRTRRLAWRKLHDDLLRRPGTPLGVALQWLRAALYRSKGSKAAQVVLVTSAVPGEGKTSLCVCFARELARSGARVLVIDADPRRPGVASAFGGSRGSDLGLFSGAPGRIEDVVRADLRSGAHFIAATSSDTFQQLIRTGELARLIEQARASYEVIILDSAPVLAGADAALIGQLADVRLFVARYGRTSWDRMMSALNFLRMGGSIVDGIVVTGVDRRDLYHLGPEQSLLSRPDDMLIEYEGRQLG